MSGAPAPEFSLGTFNTAALRRPRVTAGATDGATTNAKSDGAIKALEAPQAIVLLEDSPPTPILNGINIAADLEVH